LIGANAALPGLLCELRQYNFRENVHILQLMNVLNDCVLVPFQVKGQPGFSKEVSLIYCQCFTEVSWKIRIIASRQAQVVRQQLKGEN
jgi:hypothetical protein